MNASTHRKTRFEIRLLQQGPNSFGLICTVRGKAGEEAPPLEVPEELFTDEEMSTVHAALGILEEKFAIVYDNAIADPNYLANEIKRLNAAHKEELERVKREAADEKRRLEAALNANPQYTGELITLR
jgi:hypothetical protein